MKAKICPTLKYQTYTVYVSQRAGDKFVQIQLGNKKKKQTAFFLNANLVIFSGFGIFVFYSLNICVSSSRFGDCEWVVHTVDDYRWNWYTHFGPRAIKCVWYRIARNFIFCKQIIKWSNKVVEKIELLAFWFKNYITHGFPFFACVHIYLRHTLFFFI